MNFKQEFSTKEQKAMLAFMKVRPVSNRHLLEHLDMDAFFRLCAEHEVVALVAANMVECGLGTLPEKWQQAYEAQKQKMEELKETAEEIAQLFAEHEIDMVLLKNGGIMLDMESDCGKCAMGDLDTLVRRQDLKKAHALLLKKGFHFKFRSEFEVEDLEQAFQDGSTEYYIEGKEKGIIWVEVAWRAIAGRWIRRDLEPDTEELMRDSYYAPGSRVRILSPEDNLLQVSIHAAKHSYVRAPGLRLHLDVERIVKNKEIDWDVFVLKVEKTRVKTAVYFSLLIPRQLFGTPIPEWVLQELKPKGVKRKIISRLLAKAGFLHPDEEKFGKIEFLVFQCLLYDGFRDMWKVFYPGSSWMKERYGCKNSLMLPYYLLKRGLDLVGIRKRK